MALWQFELDPIPASRANLQGARAIHLSRDVIDEIELDLPPDRQEKLFLEFDRLLPPKPPWSPEMRLWGDERTDDIQAHLEGSRMVALQIRLDVSSLNMPFIGGICDVAREFAWVFASRQGAVFLPTREAVVRAAMQSRASKFLADPLGYLQRAVREDGSID